MATEVAPSSSNSLAKSPAGSGEDGFVRLHITPFDANLCKIVIPASAAPNARNISYHTIETFPEKRYGFVELPQMEADKIKKKLNGAVLKGSKMRIEKARPEKQIEPEGEDDKKRKKSKKSKDADDQEERPKKRKREMGVVDGVTLKDRKVKRGWTEPLDYKNKKSKKDRDSKEKDKDAKRKQSRSKYMDHEECLLKTRIPPNEMGNLPKEDDADKQKKKKKKGSSRQVTVHEFEKTTKFMNFLRNSAPESDGKQATEYVEGTGWVDVDGNVVETVKEKVIPKPAPKKSSKPKEKPAPVSEDDDDSTSGSDTSSDDTSDEDSDEESDAQTADEKHLTKPAIDEKVDEAKPQINSGSSDSSSDSDDSDDSDEEATPKPEAVEAFQANQSLSIDIPPPGTPAAKAVHPLEALYKKPKPEGDAATAPANENKGFSFFGDDIEEEEDSIETPANGMPMTPYTQKEFEWRNLRSAAPTPDTAHPARMQHFFPAEDMDMEDADAEEYGDDAEPAAGSQQDASTSDFQKWFWENRRDLNRSWMTRRKTAAKEKRHRDNKARASKAA